MTDKESLTQEDVERLAQPPIARPLAEVLETRLREKNHTTIGTPFLVLDRFDTLIATTGVIAMVGVPVALTVPVVLSDDSVAGAAFLGLWALVAFALPLYRGRVHAGVEVYA